MLTEEVERFQGVKSAADTAAPTEEARQSGRTALLTWASPDSLGRVVAHGFDVVPVWIENIGRKIVGVMLRT